MPATFNKFNAFTADLADKVHNLNADVLKWVLTNTAPVATNAVYADISGTELANGNGYTTGGLTPTNSGVSTSSGVAKLVIQPITLTATGAVGPFRYAVLVNTTAASKNLIGWVDYGSSVTLAATETFAISPDTGAGALTIT